eukprot:Partr_v1_DN28377_c1_g1_i3_m79201 putative ubiquitin carboxyl-terminal hydrolase
MPSKEMTLQKPQGMPLSPQSPTTQSMEPPNKRANMSIDSPQASSMLPSASAKSQLPSLNEQKQFLGNALAEPLFLGNTMCLLSGEWQIKYERYCDGFLDSPGPVDNKSILDEFGALRSGLLENVDFFFVSLASWNQLTAWHGSLQPPIGRSVIEDSGLFGRPIVEVYMPVYSAFTYGDSKMLVHNVTVSRKDSIHTLKEKACEMLFISVVDDCRIWGGGDLLSFSEYQLYDSEITSIQQSPISQDAYLMIECKSADGTWPNDKVPKYGPLAKGKAASIWPDNDGSDSSLPPVPPAYSLIRSPLMAPGGWPSHTYNFSPDREPKTRGLTGLGNLGNTCFMNSALQCLSNTRPLALFFLDGTYKREINVDNPLGMQGRIAEAFGDLVNQLWRTNDDSTSPRDFKSTIGLFAPQFTGYQQHDSQELLAFLLDGLHEDLNRIHKKPYIDVPDYDGKIHDAEFATKMWNIHKARNDSVIVDYFQGQFKSTLICPECSKLSITFDPYMYLTLPLPVQKKKSLKFTFVPNIDNPNLKKPVFETLMLASDMDWASFKALLGLRYGVSSANLQCVEEFSNKIYKWYQDDEVISDVAANDHVFVYECLAPMKPRVKEISYSFIRSSSSPVPDDPVAEVGTFNVPLYFYREHRNDAILLPAFITVPSKILYTELKTLISDEIARRTTYDVKSYIEGRPSDDDEDPAGSLFTIRVRTGDHGSTSSIQVADDGSLTVDGRIDFLVIFPEAVADELFSDVNKVEDVKQGELQKPGPSTAIDLRACFDEFSKAEQLGADDAWYCPNCKKHQQAEKKLDLWTVPDILVVHLKRFSHNRYHRDKLENYIEYPLKDFDLAELVQGPQKGSGDLVYDLFAVSNHFGGLGGGHYTAYAKNALDDSWHDFDDSRVSKIDENTVKTKSAYLLFYQKRSSSKMEFKGPPMAATSEIIAAPLPRPKVITPEPTDMSSMDSIVPNMLDSDSRSDMDSNAATMQDEDRDLLMGSGEDEFRPPYE